MQQMPQPQAAQQVQKRTRHNTLVMHMTQAEFGNEIASGVFKANLALIGVAMILAIIQAVLM